MFAGRYMSTNTYTPAYSCLFMHVHANSKAMNLTYITCMTLPLPPFLFLTYIQIYIRASLPAGLVPEYIYVLYMHQASLRAPTLYARQASCQIQIPFFVLPCPNRVWLVPVKILYHRSINWWLLWYILSFHFYSPGPSSRPPCITEVYISVVHIAAFMHACMCVGSRAYMCTCYIIKLASV